MEFLEADVDDVAEGFAREALEDYEIVSGWGVSKTVLTEAPE